MVNFDSPPYIILVRLHQFLVINLPLSRQWGASGRFFGGQGHRG